MKFKTKSYLTMKIAVLYSRFFYLLIFLCCLSCQKSSNEPVDNSPSCQGFCGSAQLNDIEYHEGIGILIRELNLKTSTEASGYFEFPMPDDGRYTVIAAHAFFIPDSYKVEISDSTAIGRLNFQLDRYLSAKIFPDTSIFHLNDSLKLTIEILNLIQATMYGPGFIRDDQVWLRDLNDTDKIYRITNSNESAPLAVQYGPREKKTFSFSAAIADYHVPVGVYQVWLADNFGPVFSSPFQPIVSVFGTAFGTGKSWASFEIRQK